MLCSDCSSVSVLFYLLDTLSVSRLLFFKSRPLFHLYLRAIFRIRFSYFVFRFPVFFHIPFRLSVCFYIADGLCIHPVSPPCLYAVSRFSLTQKREP